MRKVQKKKFLHDVFIKFMVLFYFCNWSIWREKCSSVTHRTNFFVTDNVDNDIGKCNMQKGKLLWCNCVGVTEAQNDIILLKWCKWHTRDDSILSFGLWIDNVLNRSLCIGEKKKLHWMFNIILVLWSSQ